MKTKTRCIVFPIAIVLVLAGIATLGVDTHSQWYINLIKPVFQPPSWAFGAAWAVIYGLIAYVLVRVCLTGKPERKKLYGYFALNGFFNVIWNYLFFRLHNPLLSLIDIVLVFITIVILIRKTHAVDRIASYLLYAYLAWVGFATVINYSIYMLNL